jgi:DNA polymerase III alpha subunit
LRQSTLLQSKASIARNAKKEHTRHGAQRSCAREIFKVIVLNAKTDYSFMRGYGLPQQWLERARQIGVTDFGIADYCSTWGHSFFRQAFKGTGIKLIYGVQLPVVTRLDKDPRHSLVTLLATDALPPLYELVTKANEQAYYRPRVTWDQIAKFPGIVIVDETLNIHAKYAKKYPTAEKAGAYGPRFPSPELRAGYNLMQGISGDQRMGEIEFDAVHMLRQSEFDALYPAADKKLMAKIAKACVADIPPGTLIVPKVYKNKRKQLEKMAFDGAIKLGLIDEDGKGNAKTQSTWLTLGYAERLKRELDVICAKNFEDYFFFVTDIMQWASKRMFVGPGRGSAGGSLLCFLLGITTVDPLKFGTMFERFIDITRDDLPDIDIDFPDVRREEVFNYLKDTYGAERVARLGTVSEFGGKSAINDTAKALGVPREIAQDIGRLTEGVGQGVVITPARIFGMDGHTALLTPEQEKMVEKYPQIKQAVLIDSHVRHHGVHAAGVVVTQGKVTDHGSLTKDGVLTMDMRQAEKIGLVKMDALGLRTLTVIQDCCDLAGIDPRTLYTLDWEDTEVYDKVFNADRVTGIFQFEGNAVRSLMKGIKVERFDDICALASLARPGPLVGGAAGHWVKVRRGDEEPRDLHPSLESTYGVIAYQEQMMQIMRDIGGFDVPSVNGARRAVGKKDPEKLKSYRGQFVAGAYQYFTKDRVNYTVDVTQVDPAIKQAEALWDELEEFGSYAFNLAHAVEYGMISFMTAWLKTKYPLQFAAACLRNAADDEQGKSLLRELSEEGYEYVTFDAEKSQASWSIQDGKLYGGFTAVRGIGTKTAATLVAARDANPTGWMDGLTESMRKKIENGVTPWASLTYFQDTFGDLYKDPSSFKRSYAPAGFKPPILKLKDIPEAKGSYAFLGRIKRVMKKDQNDEARVAKRGGQKYDKNTWFINLIIEDDTGEVGATINRFKAESFAWLTEEVMEGRDFFFRGNIIADGRKWFFIDNIVELAETEGTKT